MNSFAGCTRAGSEARVRRGLACALALAVAVIATLVSAGTASATTTVTCTPQAATMTTPATFQVAVSGATSSGSPIAVSVVSGDYQVALGGTTVCSGTSDSVVSGDPDLDVSSSDVQYLVLDDSNGSLGSGCTVQVSSRFTAASDTVAVDGSSTGATFGVTSSSVNLANCTTPDIVLGSNVATLAINGAGGQANGLDLSNAAGSLGIDMPTAAAGTVTGFDGGPVSTVDFSNVVSVTGPTGGDADFVAQSPSASFTGQGSSNTLDLSALATSPSTRLYINASGFLVSAGGQELANDQLQVGSTTDSFSDIAEFVGSDSGDTTLYGGSEAFGFEGQQSGNTLDLTGLASSPSSRVTISVPSGTVMAGSVTDSFTGVSTFSGPVSGDTTFEAGIGTATFDGNGSGNTLDLAALPATAGSPATANFTGSPVDSLANDAVSQGANGVTVSDVSSVVGPSSGNTDMLVGSSSPAFFGQGSGNELDLTRLAAPLSIDTSGSYTSGATSNTFSGVQTFLGSDSGNTTLAAGSARFTFDGFGSGNVLDLSALPSSSSTPATIDVNAGRVMSGATTDNFSGVSVLTGPTGGNATFEAGSGSATFTGQGPSNTLDLSALTSQSSLTAAVTGAGTGQVTASGSALTDNFSDVSTLDGSSTVPTTFKPDASASSTPSPLILFVGKDASAGGSTVDLSNLTTGISSLTVALGANSKSTPGQITGSVSSTPVRFATFASINELIGPSTPPASLNPGSVADGVQLVNIAPAAQLLSFTSTPTSHATQGGSYTPTATGGGSGKPIVFGIDSTSTSGACSINGGGVISFTGPGTCIVDATQGASDEYQAARAQQTFQIATAATPPAPTVTTQEIRKTLDSEATPPARTTIQTVLKSGGATVRFKALLAGTATVSWYEVPAGAQIARVKAKPKPILIAKGTLTFSTAGSRNLKIKLTAAGRRVLKHTERIKLTSKVTFKAAGRSAVTTSKKFTLHRR